MDLKNIEWIVQNREDEIHELRQAIENFSIVVRAASLASKPVFLRDFYSRFKQMKPCLHRQCLSEVIDIPAQIYSLQRVPLEVTQKKSVYIQKEPQRSSIVDGITRLCCNNRRRAAYDLGKTIEFVALEGETDIFDIITCLTMHGIEAGKIRKKLTSSQLAGEVSSFDSSNTSSIEKNQLYARIANTFGSTFERLLYAENSLGGRYMEVLKNILSNDPDEMRIEFDSGFSLTDASVKAKHWSERICKRLQGYEDRPIAIISSDSHSIVNCFTGFAIENRDEIVDRAGNCIETDGLDLTNPSSIYFLLQNLCRREEHSDLLKRKIEYETDIGVRVVKDKWDTGVDVQIIDTSKVLLRNHGRIDPRINKEGLFDRGLIILNMDYSFGRQGTYNLSELCNRLEDRIESISIIGKAGITSGNRFDIMIPSYIIPQINGGPYEFPSPNGLSTGDFSGLLTDQTVRHGGPILTVPGTAMQNELVLYYYMHNYGILGLEMEAAPYLEAVIKAKKKGAIGDIRLNVGYWASDSPLNPEETLAESHMERGCIPSYALNLAILNKVLRK